MPCRLQRCRQKGAPLARCRRHSPRHRRRACIQTERSVRAPSGPRSEQQRVSRRGGSGLPRTRRARRSRRGVDPRRSRPSKQSQAYTTLCTPPSAKARARARAAGAREEGRGALFCSARLRRPPRRAPRACKAKPSRARAGQQSEAPARRAPSGRARPARARAAAALAMRAWRGQRHALLMAHWALLLWAAAFLAPCQEGAGGRARAPLPRGDARNSLPSGSSGGRSSAAPRAVADMCAGKNRGWYPEACRYAPAPLQEGCPRRAVQFLSSKRSSTLGCPRAHSSAPAERPGPSEKVSSARGAGRALRPARSAVRRRSCD